MARYLVTISWDDEEPTDGFKIITSRGKVFVSRSKETLTVTMNYVEESEAWELLDKIRADAGYGRPWRYLDFTIDFMYKLGE